MKRVLVAMGAVMLLGATLAGVSLATGPMAAQAPNARLAVVIAATGPTGTFQILRAKGVASVTNPLTGFFCIKPSSTTMRLGRIVPTVSVDAGRTPNADTTVVWSSLNIGCPSGTIEV